MSLVQTVSHFFSFLLLSNMNSDGVVSHILTDFEQVKRMCVLLSFSYPAQQLRRTGHGRR